MLLFSCPRASASKRIFRATRMPRLIKLFEVFNETFFSSLFNQLKIKNRKNKNIICLICSYVNNLSCFAWELSVVCVWCANILNSVSKLMFIFSLLLWSEYEWRSDEMPYVFFGYIRNYWYIKRFEQRRNYLENIGKI